MMIQWCLKGIPEQPGFSDPEACAAVDREGLASTWLRQQPGALPQLPTQTQAALSQRALDLHVNGLAPGHPSPYLSLSAGSTEVDPLTRTPVRHAAWITALSFATQCGQAPGYVFRLWTLVSPKPAAELPGFAEEVRDLNLFFHFAPWHTEGEVAAKLYVPARQIQWVWKFDAQLNWISLHRNPVIFVPPERVSTIVGEV